MFRSRLPRRILEAVADEFAALRLPFSSQWAPIAAATCSRTAHQPTTQPMLSTTAAASSRGLHIDAIHIRALPQGIRAACSGCYLAGLSIEQQMTMAVIAGIRSNHTDPLCFLNVPIGRCRWSSTAAGASEPNGGATSVSVFPSFPSEASGGIIMGPIEKIEAAVVSEESRKIVSSSVFDQEYQYLPERTGRKQLGRMLKGDYVTDYYLDKNTDPLMVNVDGGEQAVARAERNERGFKRRRPQKKTPEAAAKAAKKKKK